MRKIISIVFLALLPLSMMAGPVTKNKAAQNARQFLLDTRVDCAVKKMKMAYLSVNQENPDRANYYVYNIGDDEGFVIVSGDDRAAAVLGYSDMGKFDFDHMPDNLRWWMQYYAEAMEYVTDSQASAPSSQSRPKDFIPPLLKTKWNQDAPYNLFCPDYNGRQCPTGCTATAIAQVLNYHRYPDGETKSIPGYNSQTINKWMPLLPATTFEWDKMRNSYTSTSSQESKEAVAKLMQYCGQLVEMDYTPDGSGASASVLASRLPQFFNYPNTIHSVSREGYSIAEWDSLLLNELRNNRPVLYTGYTTSWEGHAFVCDGYNGNGLYHINWGWGGAADGYFRISVLDAGTGGIGGGNTSYKFSLMQGALLGIQASGQDDFVGVEDPVTICARPSLENGREYERLSVEQDFEDVRAFISMITKKERDSWQTVGMALCDENNQILSVLCSESKYFWSGYPNDFLWNLPFGKDITQGHYAIRPVYKIGNSWYLADGAQGYYLDVKIDSLNMTLTPVPKGDFVVNSVKKKNGFLIVNLTNNDEEIVGYMYLSKLNEQGQFDAIGYEHIAIEANSTSDISIYLDDKHPLDLDNDVFTLSVDEFGHYFYCNVKNDGAEIGQDVRILNLSDDSTSIVGDRAMVEFSVTNKGTGVYHHFIQAGVCNQQGEMKKGSLLKVVDLSPGETMLFREDFLLTDFDTPHAVSVRHYDSDNKMVPYETDYYNTARGAIFWTADGSLHTMPAAEPFVVPEEALAINVRNAYTKTVTPNSNPNTLYLLDRSVPKSLTGHNILNYQNKTGVLTLTDGYDYYIPEPVTVTSSVRYVREFDADDAGKWSSVVLPFEVDEVKVDNTPADWFHTSDAAGKDFWLQGISSIQSGVVKMNDVPTLQANQPYLIATDGSLTGKQVVFSAGATTLSPTDSVPKTLVLNGFELCWNNLSQEIDELFVLDGSAFVWSSTPVMTIPFRVYLRNADTTGGTSIGLEGPAVPNYIKELPNIANTDMTIYNLAGIKVGTLGQLDRLPMGIYLISGRKIIIK